LVAGR